MTDAQIDAGVLDLVAQGVDALCVIAPRASSLDALRRHGVPVSLREWLDLMAAMEAGVAGWSVDDFHTIGRAILVKDERHIDRFDRAFAAKAEITHRIPVRRFAAVIGKPGTPTPRGLFAVEATEVTPAGIGPAAVLVLLASFLLAQRATLAAMHETQASALRSRVQALESTISGNSRPNPTTALITRMVINGAGTAPVLDDAADAVT